MSDFNIFESNEGNLNENSMEFTNEISKSDGTVLSSLNFSDTMLNALDVTRKSSKTLPVIEESSVESKEQETISTINDTNKSLNFSDTMLNALDFTRKLSKTLPVIEESIIQDFDESKKQETTNGDEMSKVDRSASKTMSLNFSDTMLNALDFTRKLSKTLPVIEESIIQDSDEFKKQETFSTNTISYNNNDEVSKSAQFALSNKSLNFSNSMLAALEDTRRPSNVQIIDKNSPVDRNVVSFNLSDSALDMLDALSVSKKSKSSSVIQDSDESKKQETTNGDEVSKVDRSASKTMSLNLSVSMLEALEDTRRTSNVQVLGKNDSNPDVGSFSFSDSALIMIEALNLTKSSNQTIENDDLGHISAVYESDSTTENDRTFTEEVNQTATENLKDDTNVVDIGLSEQSDKFTEILRRNTSSYMSVDPPFQQSPRTSTSSNGVLRKNNSSYMSVDPPFQQSPKRSGSSNKSLPRRSVAQFRFLTEQKRQKSYLDFNSSRFKLLRRTGNDVENSGNVSEEEINFGRKHGERSSFADDKENDSVLIDENDESSTESLEKIENSRKVERPKLFSNDLDGIEDELITSSMEDNRQPKKSVTIHKEVDNVIGQRGRLVSYDSSPEFGSRSSLRTPKRSGKRKAPNTPQNISKMEDPFANENDFDETMKTNICVYNEDDEKNPTPRILKKKQKIILCPRQIIKPEETVNEKGLRRSQRTRVKTCRSWYGEKVIYKRNPDGTRSIVGVTEVEFKDKMSQKYLSASPSVQNAKREQERKARQKRKEMLKQYKQKHRINLDETEDIL